MVSTRDKDANESPSQGEIVGSEPADYTGRDNLEVMLAAENYNAWLCELVSRRASAGTGLLDFGAGTGTFAMRLAAQGYDVTCVEPDGILRRTLVAGGLKAVPSLGSLENATAGFIYTFNVLEHIEDDVAAMAELAGTLRPGGTLLVYVPAFMVLYSSMDEKVGHFRRYRLNELKRKLRASGLTVRYARYGDSLGYFATLAYKLLGSRDGSLNEATIRLYDRVFFPMSRALDLLLGRVIGKNAIVVATKPG